MDPRRLDAIARRLAGTSRRTLLRALAGGGLGLRLVLADRADAAKACLKEGKLCKRDRQCCSGVCKGKQGKRKCRRTPGQSICTIRNDSCLPGVETECGVGPLFCACVTTVTGRAVCVTFPDEIRSCASDLDCVTSLGEGFVCRRRGGGGTDCGDEPVCVPLCPDPV